MRFNEFSEMVLPKIQDQMEVVISLAKQNNNDSLHQMLSYHLGWTNSKKGKPAQGKRIRPLILLLSTETSGGNWQNAVAAAAAVELIHNFSLIHDDIEDESEYRRGRQTLWKIHGLPIAINAGDALYSLSFICLGELIKRNSFETSFQAFNLLSEACLAITKGQHLDISFETVNNITVSEYMEMIEGKTASLLAMSAKLGALIAGADSTSQNLYYDIGKNLGLAFQVYDDILGIWGKPEITGKSTATDLITRKKSLPILYGLSNNHIFREMWASDISADNISLLADQLREEGAYDYSQGKAEEFTTAAIEAFDSANPSGQAVEAFQELINSLTQRKS